MNDRGPPKVLVLGGSGMLGNALFRSLSVTYDTYATSRTAEARAYFSAELRERIIPGFDASDSDGIERFVSKTRPDVVINCIGLIKQIASANDPLVALPINALLPHRLARTCALANIRLIHISTDCVFSGSKGNYIEDDVCDAYDLYGKSKALGELVDYDNAITLRTSIIGREVNSSRSLLEWFLGQEGVVRGYTKAIFSGLPTIEIARIIGDIVIPHQALRGLYHVAARPIAKFDLLRLIAAQYGKKIEIVRDEKVIVDRSLNSDRFRKATGYSAPNWSELIQYMYATDFRR
jgi:dTDP-4-dehydrorhamnose reductase